MDNIQNIYQLLNMGFNPNLNTKNTKIIITPPLIIVDNQEFAQYSHQIKALYLRIFASVHDSQDVKKMQIKLDLNFPIKETPMPICNKILSPDQPVYRCYDCMTHQASVLCKKCFQNANHKGHRYSQISSGGGNCDCGNPDAIKPVGFCIHHPGKAQPVEIAQKQKQSFLETTLMLFEWIFRLYQKAKSKSSDILGQIVADFLNKVNEKSLYYNTLTFHLLMSKRKYGLTPEERQENILAKIFQYGVKLVNFAKKITDVFLNMFSLDVFKYELTVAFTKAYNKYDYFQTSKFRNLYIQLYANNDILQRLLVQKKLVLYPQAKYDYTQYVENLMFLSTIKPQVASKFFILLNHKGIVRIPLLDMVQDKVQNKGEHIVSVINNNLNTENFYYVLMESFIRLIQNCQPSMIQMLRNYVDAIMDGKYTNKKNKVILPFHKVLSIILLQIYQGQVEKINAFQIEKFLDGKYKVKDVFMKIFRLILECFRQFSKTLFETSYFDNYIPLYVKSGIMIIKFDLLMFSMCVQIFKQLNLEEEMNTVMEEIFSLQNQTEQKRQIIEITNKEQKSQGIQMQNQDDFESVSSQSLNNNNEQQTLRKLKINTQLLKIIIESCVSNRSENVLSGSIKIQNPLIQQRSQKLFVEAINNFKQITADNIKQINKSFTDTKYIDDFIKKFFNFDKNKKKYTLNKANCEKISDKKFPLFLCMSLKKYGGIFAQQKNQPLQNLLLNLDVPKGKLQKLRFILNQKFLEKVMNEFNIKLKQFKAQGNKQIQKVFLDFVQVIRTIQYLIKQHAPTVINNFFEQLLQLSQLQQYKFLDSQVHKKVTLENKQEKKRSTQMKFQEIKKKKLQRMKKMQSTFDDLLEKQKIEQQEEKDQSLCIICRQDKPGLCFLANFNYSNNLQCLMKSQGRFLVFSSCFHPIHINCFRNASKRDQIPCPLCKTTSNIMLPFEKQISDAKTISEIFERIITLRVSFREIYSGFDKQFEQFGILSIFRSLSSIICKQILQGQPIIRHKDQRLANIMYNMSKNLSQSYFGKARKQTQINAVKDFLALLKCKIESQKQQNNFYVLEYISLKVFYLCYIQKSEECLNILRQPFVALLHKNDLKRLWVMCGQIVTLPQFKQVQFTKIEEKQINQKITFYSPPENVQELIKLRDEASNLCKNGHQICICIICQQKHCLDCRQMLRHSSKVHCGECVSFNLLTGGFEYYMDTRVVHFPSLYENELGYEWKPSKSPKGFTLDTQCFERIKKQIINDTILKFLNGKYPEAFKKSLFFEMNIY